MFEKLVDLSFERSRKQAVGFYIVYLLVFSLLAGVIVLGDLAWTGKLAMIKVENFTDGLEVAKPIVPKFIFAVSVLLALLVIWAKKSYTAVSFVCVLLAGLLSKGAVLSLIPVAYLTTLPKGNKP